MDQERTQGPAVLSPGRVPLGRYPVGPRLLLQSCTQKPQLGTPRARARPLPGGAVTTLRSPSSPQPRLGPARAPDSESGSCSPPRAPRPTRSCDPTAPGWRISLWRILISCRRLPRPTDPELDTPTHRLEPRPPSAALWRNLDQSPLPFSPSQPSFSRLREEPGREGGGERGAAG